MFYSIYALKILCFAETIVKYVYMRLENESLEPPSFLTAYSELLSELLPHTRLGHQLIAHLRYQRNFKMADEGFRSHICSAPPVDCASKVRPCSTFTLNCCRCINRADVGGRTATNLSALALTLADAIPNSKTNPKRPHRARLRSHSDSLPSAQPRRG